MPRYDGTGPERQGPGTGKGMGRCTGINRSEAPGRPYSGYGRGRGMSYGRGSGRGMGRGHGMGRCMGGVHRGRMNYAQMPAYAPVPEDEKLRLEEFAEQLKADLDNIEERIEELKKSEETEE